MTIKTQLLSLSKNRTAQLGGSAALAFAIGAASSYLVVRKQLETKYQEISNREIAEAKQFFGRLHKTTDEYLSPEKLLEQRHGVKAEKALTSYQGLDADAPKVKERDLFTEEQALEEVAEGMAAMQSRGEDLPPEVRNILESAGSEPEIPDITGGFDYETELARRDGNVPYVITHDEFFEGELDYEQVSLTYFEGDDVLADDKDVPVDDAESTVSESNLTRFGHGSKDNNIVYIRNDNLNLDFEISRSNGTYAAEVLGFIEHSHKPGLRKFRGFDE